MNTQSEVVVRAVTVGSADARPYKLPVLAVLAKHPQWQGLSITEVLSRLAELPDDFRTSVRNMGGGHFNHTFFWSALSAGARGKPPGDLLGAIIRDFSSFDQFIAQFEAVGTKHFGSGWVWLVADPRKACNREIVTLPNQDTVIGSGKAGVLACDLWEHAYYLE
jgi:Fe-Mn family superoxide dismutase